MSCFSTLLKTRSVETMRTKAKAVGRSASIFWFLKEEKGPLLASL